MQLFFVLSMSRLSSVAVVLCVLSSHFFYSICSCDDVDVHLDLSYTSNRAPAALSMALPLRSITKIRFGVCAVKGLYPNGKTSTAEDEALLDAILCSTDDGRMHQFVHVEDIGE